MVSNHPMSNELQLLLLDIGKRVKSRSLGNSALSWLFLLLRQATPGCWLLFDLNHGV